MSEPLDTGIALLSLVLKPTTLVFNSGPFPICDYQGHIYNISVIEGTAKLVAGSPGPKIPVKYDEQITSTDDKRISGLAEELKSKIEEAFDIELTTFQMQWGLKNCSHPTLLGCNGTEFVTSGQLSEYIDLLPVVMVFYASEAAAQIIPSQCYTKGKNCFGGSQTIERSKIINIKIRKFMEAYGIADEQLSSYIKKRFSSLFPTMFMSSVPVCPTCFKYYSFKANVDQKNKNSSKTRPTTAQTQRAITRAQSQRPTTKQDTRSSLPMLSPPKPFGFTGDVTQSGLIMTQDYAAQAVQFAHKLYRNPPFNRPPPPPPPRKVHSSLNRRKSIT